MLKIYKENNRICFSWKDIELKCKVSERSLNDVKLLHNYEVSTEMIDLIKFEIFFTQRGIEGKPFDPTVTVENYLSDKDIELIKQYFNTGV